MSSISNLLVLVVDLEPSFIGVAGDEGGSARTLVDL